MTHASLPPESPSEQTNPPPADTIIRLENLRFIIGGSNNLAWTHDGRFLVASGGRGIALFDPTSGKQYAHTKFDGNPLHGLVVSADSMDFLVHQSSNFHHIRLDPADQTLKTVQTFEDISYGCAVFLPKTNAVALVQYNGKVIQIRDLDSSKVIRELPLGRGTPRMITCSRDGQTLMGPVGKGVRLWSVKETGKPRALRGHKDKIRWIAPSPDSRFLISYADDETHRLWDLNTGETLWENLGQCTSNIVCTDDTYFIGNNDKLERRELATGALLNSWKAHSGYTSDLALHPSNTLLATATTLEGRAALWDRITGERRDGHGPVHTTSVRNAFQTKDGKVVSWDSYGTIHVWLRRSGEHLLHIDFDPTEHGDDSNLHSRIMAVCAQGNSLFVASSQRAYAFDLTTGAFLRAFAPTKQKVVGLGASPDGRILVVCTEKPHRRKTTEVHFFNASNGDVLSTQKVRMEVRLCRFLDNNLLLTISSNGAITWDLTAFAMVEQVDFVQAKSHSSFNYTATGSVSRDVSLWCSGASLFRTSNGEPYTRLNTGWSLFSPDSDLLYITKDNKLQGIDPRSREVLDESPLPFPNTHFHAALPDRTFLCHSTGEGLYLWRSEPEAAATQDANVRMAKLRELLYEPPSPNAWKAVCGLLSDWKPSEGQSIGLDYARTHLETWPAIERTVLSPWFDTAMDGQSEPCLGLARSMSFKGNKAQMGALLASPDLEQIQKAYIYSSPAKDIVPLLLKHRDVLRLESLGINDTDLSESQLVEMAEQPSWFEHLQTLRIFNEKRLGNSPAALMKVPFTNLQHFGLNKSTFDIDKWLEALKSTTHIDTLQILMLQENGLSPAQVQRLINTGHLSSLQTLDLFKNGTAGIADALSQGSSLSGLTELLVGDCHIGPEELARLLEADFAPQLHRLSLQHNMLPDLKPLRDATHVEQLRWLTFSLSGLNKQAFETLLEARHLTRLERLDLHHNKLGDIGALAHATHLSNLSVLSISYCELSPAMALSTLSRIPHMGQLTSLYLSNNNQKSASEPVFEPSKALRSLEVLDLSNTNLTGQQLLDFLTLTEMPRLRSLDMSRTYFGKEIAEVVAASAFAPNLQKLWVSPTDEAREVIASHPAFPAHIRKGYTRT